MQQQLKLAIIFNIASNESALLPVTSRGRYFTSSPFLACSLQCEAVSLLAMGLGVESQGDTLYARVSTAWFYSGFYSYIFSCVHHVLHHPSCPDLRQIMDQWIRGRRNHVVRLQSAASLQTQNTEAPPRRPPGTPLQGVCWSLGEGKGTSTSSRGFIQPM